MEELSPVVLRVIGRDDTKKAFDSVRRNTEQGKNAVDRLIKATAEYRATLGMTAENLRIYKAQQMGATKAQLEALKHLNTAIVRTKQSALASKGLTQQFRFMRGGLGQVGHQIQDVAVQLQMGTNAMLVFGQQGSQIASLFGPYGALLGAVLAVGGAIGTYFATRAEKAAEETKKLSDRIRDLAAETDNLSRAQALLLLSDMAPEQIELTNTLREQTTEVERLEKQYRILQNVEAQLAKDLSSDAFKDSTVFLRRAAENQEALLETYNALRVARGELELTRAEWDKMAKTFEEIRGGGNPFGDSSTGRDSADEEARKREEAMARMRRSIAQSLQARRDAAAEEQRLAQEAYDRAESDLTRVENYLANELTLIRQAESEKALIVEEAVNQRVISERHGAMLIEKIYADTAQNIQATMLMTMGSILSTTSQQISQLGAMFEEGSAMGKAFFLVSQTIAAADAIIKGFQSSMAIRLAYAQLAAMTGNPAIASLGEAHAMAAKVMGFATAGAIMGQTAASFEGGGITFSGVRSGGLDGKGGRMAVVHPNEKITDLERGGGEQPAVVNVSFNITANDSKGFDELLIQRRGLITNLVNRAINNRGRSSLA